VENHGRRETSTSCPRRFFIGGVRDPFLQAAIDEARRGLAEGGIPIGSVIVHRETIIGRGHNMRVQKGDPLLHGEMSALQQAGRQPASVYRECVLYDALTMSDVQWNCAPLQNSENRHWRKSDIPWRRRLAPQPGSAVGCRSG
jgi:Cytidine and deoxycytidylate deaminase zinc-binding region